MIKKTEALIHFYGLSCLSAFARLEHNYVFAVVLFVFSMIAVIRYWFPGKEEK